jgi:hypothetical protein
MLQKAYIKDEVQMPRFCVLNYISIFKISNNFNFKIEISK